MKILLTSTSFQDTPGEHHDLINNLGYEIIKMRGPLTEEKLINIITDFDCLLCGDDEITYRVIEKGSKQGKLKIISKYGIGLDKIDLDAAKKFNIIITNCPGVNKTTVAEHVFALILSFVKNIVKEGNIILAELDIEIIEKRRLDKILIKGYEKFPKSYVKNYLRLTSKVFNKDEITTQTKRIDQLRFARQLKDPELLFTKDSTTLYIYVEKVKSNFFDGFIGFNSDEDTGNLKLNGYLDLKLINNLNSGEEFNILWKNDGNKQTKFLADLKLPYLFNSPIGVNAALDIFKRDSLFTTVNTTFKTFYQICCFS